MCRQQAAGVRARACADLVQQQRDVRPVRSVRRAAAAAAAAAAPAAAAAGRHAVITEPC